MGLHAADMELELPFQDTDAANDSALLSTGVWTHDAGPAYYPGDGGAGEVGHCTHGACLWKRHRRRVEQFKGSPEVGFPSFHSVLFFAYGTFTPSI